MRGDEAFARAAAAWREPDYPPRAEAVRLTLSAPNRFTEEALTFALNQQMHRLGEASPPRLADEAALTVAVLHAGTAPLEDFRDGLAVLRSGQRYVGRLAPGSPYLWPAFLDTVRQHAPGLPASFAEGEAIFAAADAVLGFLDAEDVAEVTAACARHGIAAHRCLLRARRYAVAVLDGRETPDEREGLAEDMLLHEGLDANNVAVVWAPRGLAPDAYLESFAHFRAVFPTHPHTAGALAMQKAFLDAAAVPHAHGDGLEFLLSRGAPEVQAPGHVRWAEYDALGTVEAWLEDRAAEVSVVLAREAVQDALAAPEPFALPGHAHRPPPGRYPLDPTEAFLQALGREPGI